MEMNLTFEERQLCREFGALSTLPDGTPKSVIQKLTESTRAFLKQATSSPAQRRHYQMPISRRPVNKFSIAQTLMADFRGLPLENIKRLLPLGVDALNRALLVRKGEQILRSATWGVDFPEGTRFTPGDQTSDPQQLCRTASTKFQHQDAAAFHRGQAAKETDWFRCISHHQAADAHSVAARAYPDLEKSAAARVASRALVG
jgi:hypothetical protein